MILYILLVAMTSAAAAGVNGTEKLPRGTRGRELGRSCQFLIFLMLTVPAVLRQETGNDYLRYVEFFHLASIDAYVPTEPGFNVLVKFIYNLCGYENYLLVFAVFSVLTIFFFLAAIRQQAENYAFSFFLFMTFGYYFRSFNTMRYYFALALVIVSMTYFIRRNYAAFLLLVLLAALFHKSALIVLILYPLAVHVWKIWQILVGIAAGAAVLFFHEPVLQLLVDLYPTWEDTGDLAAGTTISWVNIARCAAVLVLCAVVVRVSENQSGGKKETAPAGTSQTGTEKMSETVEEERSIRALLTDRSVSGRQIRMYVNGTAIGLWIYLFCWFVPEVSRICYYLVFGQIFLIPILLERIPEEEERPELRRLLSILVIAAAVFYFAFFLHSAYGDTAKLLPYKTFLFHDLNETPSGSIE